MSKFFLSLFLFALGFVIMKYAYQIMQFFGKLEWAEDSFGGGGTFTFYKILGVFFMVAGLFHLFGVWTIILRPLGRLFGG